MCECCLKLKSELQEMRIQLKSATATVTILKEDLDIVYYMNEFNRTTQGHDENIQPTHHLKWI